MSALGLTKFTFCFSEIFLSKCVFLHIYHQRSFVKLLSQAITGAIRLKGLLDKGKMRPIGTAVMERRGSNSTLGLSVGISSKVKSKYLPLFSLLKVRWCQIIAKNQQAL